MSPHDWFGLVLSQVARNRAVVSKMLADDSVPMSYYRVFRDVQKVLPKDAIIVRAAVVGGASHGDMWCSS